MAEGGNGGSRPDLDDEPVGKALHGTCDSDTDTDAYEIFPPDHSRRTVAQRSADLESGSWIQVPESTVPSIPGEPYHSPVGPTSYVQVNNSQGVHVGPVIHHHYHRQGIDESGRAVPPETQADSAPLSSVASQVKANETRIRGESDNYSSGCRKKTGNFVKTTLYYLARKEIGERKTVLLLGGMGDGKSSIIQYIAANPMEDYFPIPCASPKEIQRYLKLTQGTNIKLLFVLDDPVGGSYTQQKLVDKWIHMMGDLEICLTQNKHKFLFAMRKSIWAECKVYFEKRQFFCNTAEVTSSLLTAEDKFKMLERYLGISGQLAPQERDKIVRNDKPLAFGQCCRMARDLGEVISGKEIVRIFEKPFAFLRSELEKMAVQTYATLSLIMLCGGQLECKQLRGTLSEVKPDVKGAIDDVIAVCKGPTLTRGDLHESAEKLTGTHLEKLQATCEDSSSCEVYQFSHDSIHEAVMMHFGQLHPGHCLKYLNPDVVVNIARPHNHEKREQEFVINFPSENYTELAGIFTTKVINENGKFGLGEVFDNPCVKDEPFQSVWVDYLRNSTDKLSTFLRSKAWFSDTCVLYFLAKSGCQTVLSLLCPGRQFECKCGGRFLPCLLEGAIDGDHVKLVSWYLSSRTLTKREVWDVVLRACDCGSVDVLRPLFSQRHAEMVMRELRAAGTFGQVRSAEFLLTHGCNPCIGPDCLCVWGLRRASWRGHTDIVRLIINSHGQNVNTTVAYPGNTCLHRAAEYGRIDLVTFLVSNGADVNAKNEEGKTSLDLAVENIKWRPYTTDVVNFLQSNGGQHSDQ